MTQLPLDLPQPPKRTAFDGKTYDAQRDYERLKGQLGKVHDLMADGQWRSLKRIALSVGGSEASVSSRLRDLRKPKYGSRVIERGLAYELEGTVHLDYRTEGVVCTINIPAPRGTS